MKNSGAASVIFLIAICAVPATSEPTILTGTVTKVRDGDTIEVGKIPIRLNGVSAPEINEPLGRGSKAFMVDLVMNKPVRCELNGERTYDRLVGICYLNSKDIGSLVIGAGGHWTVHDTVVVVTLNMKLRGRWIR
jgi:micrococcal nuclease